MRKAELRAVLAEHLAVLRRRRNEVEHILSGESRLFAGEEAQARAREDLGQLALVERGFTDMLPRAWDLEPAEEAPRREVNLATEAEVLVRARGTAAVIAMTLQQPDREHHPEDADRLLVATALFRYLRDQLDNIAADESDGDEGRQESTFGIASLTRTSGFSGGLGI